MDEKQKKLAEELLFSADGKPSFAKMLYFGLFDPSKAFPYPQPGEREAKRVDQLIEQLELFAHEEIDAASIDREANIPGRVINGLAEMGILSMSIPQEYGGLGLSQWGYCRVMERLARHCNATALFVNAHQSVGMKALLLFGTEEQKSKWLKELASGEKLSAFSLTERQAGSDVSAIQTQALYNPERRSYTLIGEKQWTTNGSLADLLTVMAKTEEGEITAFLATSDMEGFKIKDAALDKVGMRGSTTSNLIFDHVEIPEENILGPKGKGLRVCLTVLDYGRITFGATCTGGAKLLFEKALAHAKSRHQFGKPLAAFPLIKKKLARMASLAYAMDASTYLTAGLLDSGEREIMLEAAILKVFASEAMWEICYEAMQIYGGRSFFTDEPLERIMRDARLNMIGEGANEVLRIFMAAVGMREVGIRMKGSLDAMKSPFSSFSEIKKLFKSSFFRLFAPRVPVESLLIRSEAKRLGRSVRAFGWAVLKLLVRHREGIVDKQLLLERLSEAVTALYTTSAVLAKFDGDPEKRDLPLVKLYAGEALDRFDLALAGLSSNRDGEIERTADFLTGWSDGGG